MKKTRFLTPGPVKRSLTAALPANAAGTSGCSLRHGTRVSGGNAGGRRYSTALGDGTHCNRPQRMELSGTSCNYSSALRVALQRLPLMENVIFGPDVADDYVSQEATRQRSAAPRHRRQSRRLSPDALQVDTSLNSPVACSFFVHLGTNARV